MSNNYDEDWYKGYERKKGAKGAKGSKKRKILFSWQKISKNQGQSKKEWETEGLLSQFCDRIEQIEDYSTEDALAKQLIKQYTKVGFPPDSKFTKPKGVVPNYWAVIHIKPSSKAVVAGYVEGDIFYIIFLDKEHHFWPVQNIQNRGKTKR